MIVSPDSLKITATVVPGLHQIALPTPYAVGDVNVFLAEGSPITLIDCGVRSEASRAALEASLRALGYTMSAIERIIITHHHADHLGLAGEIVEASGAEVWSHPQTVRWLERPRDSLKARRRYTEGLFRAQGVPESAIQTIGGFWRALETHESRVRVSMTLDEGELLEMAGRRWQVYHTPGHAGDLICLYEPESHVLLSSDHLLRDISSNPLIEAPVEYGAARPKRLLDYMREMRRIAGLNVSVAYGGHGAAINDVRDLVNMRIGFHEKRANKLFGMLGANGEDGQTLYNLTRSLFPAVTDAHMFLTLSETLGHLDVLECEGRAVYETRREDRLDAWRWYAVSGHNRAARAS